MWVAGDQGGGRRHEGPLSTTGHGVSITAFLTFLSRVPPTPRKDLPRVAPQTPQIPQGRVHRGPDHAGRGRSPRLRARRPRLRARPAPAAPPIGRLRAGGTP